MPAKKKAVEQAKTITIPPIKVAAMTVQIEGISPLICHKMSKKTEFELLNKSMNKKTKTREAKDPQAEYMAARYRVDEDGMILDYVDRETMSFQDAQEGADAIPARYLKLAMVDAARYIEGLTMTETKALVFVEPGKDGVPIKNGKGVYGIDVEPEIQQSVQRVGGKGPGTGSPDIRFRPLYKKWGAEFEIQYNESLVGPEEVLNLLNYAGFHSGICEHRPSKGGQNGQFRVVGVKK